MAAALGAAGLAAALGGCATTMQEAARLQLNDARIRAGEVPTRVSAAGSTVTVDRVAVVRDGGRIAFVVAVHNPGSRTVSDLPVSVGFRLAGGRRVYVNAQSPLELSYFDAHLPAVTARGTLTWVYTTARRIPAHARPFALVGPVAAPAAPPTGRLPAISARAPAATTTSELPVALRNLSGVPQYQLQVYAFARSAGRYVAAGSLTVPHLGSQSSRTLTLGLLGRPRGARVEVEALPTIFQ